MHNIKNLSLIASRLLIALLLNGSEEFNKQRKTAQMEMVGTNNPKAYRKARTELEQAGLVKLETSDGVRTTIFLSSAVPVRDMYVCNMLLEGSLNGSTGETTANLGRKGTQVPGEERYPGYDDLGTLGTQVGREERYLGKKGTQVGKVPRLLDRCREVDDMDDGGEIVSKSSPFALRRLAQIPLVQEAYKQYFPYDTHILTDKNARSWLSWNENSAVQVVQELEAIAQRTSNLTGPIMYINKCFKGDRERSTASSPFLSSAVVSRPLVGAGAYIPGGDLPPPSPEYLVKLEQAKSNFERMKLEKGWIE